MAESLVSYAPLMKEILELIKIGILAKSNHPAGNRSSLFTISSLRNGIRKEEFGKPCDIAFVWGTTRHEDTTCKHPGFISDAMYTPELLQAVQGVSNWSRFYSFLDIDSFDETVRKRYNLVLFGDGEVNLMSAKFIEWLGGYGLVSYDHPTKSHLKEPLKMNNSARFGSYGVATVARNPWNESKFVILLAGVGPIGTTAIIKWFADELRTPSPLSSSSVVVVRGMEKSSYPDKFSGSKSLCASCCKPKNGKAGYWPGKISNVETVTPIYPFPETNMVSRNKAPAL
jgi:hypothetical protein